MGIEGFFAVVGYVAMLTSAINIVVRIINRESDNTDSSGDGEREAGGDSGGWDDY